MDDTFEAERQFKAAIKIAEETGPDDPRLAQSFFSLGRLLTIQKRFVDAEPLLKQALAILEKNLGPGHTSIAGHLDNLSQFYRAQGRVRDANELSARAALIRENTDAHSANWESNNTSGLLAYERGDYTKAESRWKAALEGAQAFGENDHRFAISLHHLALNYKIQGRHAKAEPLYKRSIAIREKTLASEHPSVASNLNNLAKLYLDQGKYAEAEPRFERSLAIFERALGPGHPSVAASLNNLAELYRAQGKHAEAEPLYKRSLAIVETALGPDHPEMAIYLENYAQLLRLTGRTDEAEILVGRARLIRAKHAGRTL